CKNYVDLSDHLSSAVCPPIKNHLFHTLAKVYIKELRVPQSVQNGTEDAVILDCDYTLESEDKSGLVVKWFFNKGGTPVYQWIKPNKPQVLGLLRDRVDLKYKASEDPWMKYSGIKIIKPTQILLGNGSVVFPHLLRKQPPPLEWLCMLHQKRWKLRKHPDLLLSQLTFLVGLEDVMHDSTWNDGAYDVRVSAVVKDENLELPAIFDCELKIPNTSYINRKNVLYGGPVVIVERTNETSTGSAPQSNTVRSTLITWFNIILVLAVNIKIFGLS
ncbi:hypothetical protein Ocin01_09322, partial [Orchesella cincta]